MRSQQEVALVQVLAKEGLNHCEIARQTGIPLELLALGSRFALVILFLSAGLAKLSASEEFARAVRDYDLLPARWVAPVATWLPRLEVAATLLLGLGVLTTVVAAGLAGLLLGFTAAVAVHLVRGREIDCGCFGSSAPRRITWATVARNLALTAMAALVVTWSPPALSLLPAWETGVAGAGAVATGDAVAALVASTAAAAGVLVLAEAARVHRAAGALRPRAGGPTVTGPRIRPPPVHAEARPRRDRALDLPVRGASPAKRPAAGATVPTS